jgi:hypothetical protein
MGHDTDYHSFFEELYDQDKDAYGYPEDTDETISSVTDRSSDQVVIEQLATCVKMQAVTTTRAPSEEVPAGPDEDGPNGAEDQ